MFTLITGLPGSSKSLQTIKLVETERVREDGSKRAVYYWGIPDLTLDWIPLHRADSTVDEARAQFDLGVKKLTEMGGESHAYVWHEVPTDSIVVIDECQFVFPLLTQKQRTNPPAHYGPLAVHRHSGFDLYCMTQHPSLIAVEARRQVQRHWHLERPFGLDYANRYAWEKCQSPDDRANRNAANVERMTLDKKWFGVYRSAEVHTVKKRLPWKKLAVAVGGLVAVVALFVFALAQLRPDEPEVVSGATADAPQSTASRPRQWTPEDLTERLPTWPWSAPFYDQVAKVASAPRITGCMSIRIGNVHRCTCSNGQGVAQVSPQLCRDFVAGRYYDPLKPYEDVKAENIRRLDASQNQSVDGGDVAASGSGGRVIRPSEAS
jgi:zona occludens toxin